MDRSGQDQKRETVPAGLAAECKQIAGDIRELSQSIRYDKITAARVRMSSGYYNSEHVLRTIASRLLDESQTA